MKINLLAVYIREVGFLFSLIWLIMTWPPGGSRSLCIEYWTFLSFHYYLVKGRRKNKNIISRVMHPTLMKSHTANCIPFSPKEIHYKPDDVRTFIYKKRQMFHSLSFFNRVVKQNALDALTDKPCRSQENSMNMLTMFLKITSHTVEPRYLYKLNKKYP